MNPNEYNLTQNSRRDTSMVLQKAQLIVVLMYFAVIPLKNATITHYILLLGTIISLYCIASICVTTELNVVRVLLILALGITTLISLLLSIRYLRLDLLYSLVCFYFLTVMICTNHYLYIKDDFLHYIFWITLVIAVLISIFSLMPFAYWRDDGTTSPYLTLYLGNSNYTGMMLMSVLCLLWATSYGEKHYWLVFPMSAFLLYLIVRSGSRTCIVGATVFTILSLFRSDRPINRMIVFVCMAFPVVFVPLYLWLYDNSRDLGVKLLGKSLFTGRENTFTEYLAYLQRPAQWFVGNLCEARLQNAHNAPLAVLCSFGIVGAILFFSLFYSTVWTNNKVINHPTAHTAVAALLAICVASCGEASMFMGGFPGVVFMFMFLWLSNYHAEDKSSEKGEPKCIQEF